MLMKQVTLRVTCYGILGKFAMQLGAAGRATKSDSLNYETGLYLKESWRFCDSRETLLPRPIAKKFYLKKC